MSENFPAYSEDAPHKIYDYCGTPIDDTIYANFDAAVDAMIALSDRDLADDGIDKSQPDFEELQDDYIGEYYAKMVGGDPFDGGCA